MSSYYAMRCGTVTCTWYFHISTTRLMAGYGANASIVRGKLPTFVGDVISAVADIVQRQLQEAVDASPARCFIIKELKGPGHLITSIGHVHNSNFCCRAGG